MPLHASRVALIAVLACAPLGVGCSAESELDPYNNNLVDFGAALAVDFEADTGNVTQAQVIPIEISVLGIHLVEPGATPPPEHASRAGHVRVYMDDPSSAAVLVTARTRFDFAVPLLTPPGRHRLFLRVHTHDGRPTTTIAAVDFTVRPDVNTGVE